MPGLRLPIELELYIIDLAIPPRTFYRAVERVQLCTTLALVHRDWTPRAQQHLLAHIVFQARRPQVELSERWSRSQAILESGRETKRIDLWSHDNEANAFHDIRMLNETLPKLKELGLRRSATRVDCVEDYRALVKSGFPDYLPANALPAGLRLLSIAHFTLSSKHIERIVRMPCLDALLLTGVRYDEDDVALATLVASHIRIFGLKGYHTTTDSTRCFKMMSSTVQHVALLELPPWDYLWLSNNSPTLPSTLRTLTIALHSIGDTSGTESQIEARDTRLAGAARAAGIRLQIQRCATQNEMYRLDLEEWAVSVGAL
ncbi:hypothetical protein OF846_003916 [Rhodotorula toruloides]|nr:hypothetical protein OF846_003916 [Rhodotorula toruloides]